MPTEIEMRLNTLRVIWILSFLNHRFLSISTGADDPVNPQKSSGASVLFQEKPLVAPYPESAFRRSLEQPSSLGYFDLVLLINDKIIDELGLSDEQQASVINLRQEFADDLIPLQRDFQQSLKNSESSVRESNADRQSSTFANLQKETRDSFQKKMKLLQFRYSEKCLKVLDPRQQHRLRQIKLYLWNTALYRDQKFCDYLGLSSSQIIEIESIFREVTLPLVEIVREAKRQGTTSQLAPLYSSTNSRAFDAVFIALTQEQSTKLKDLMGPKPGFAPHELELRLRINTGIKPSKE